MLVLSGSNKITRDNIGFGGAVLQVVQVVKTDTFSTSSTTRVDIAGLSATITPFSTNSKILVTLNIQGSGQASGWYGTQLTLMRNGTDIAIGDARGSRTRSTIDLSSTDNTGVYINSTSMTFLDSPNSSSPVTYKLQLCSKQATAAWINRPAGSDQDNAYATTVPSSITLMEIAG
ncbi:hypothetical protein [Flavobacterium sp.]|jgi:hypothetical protein|uniref:hypothetical protein n=1 Tax=Flavobacterium sp. TaxID=239 RepID=UPI0037BE7DE0